MGSIFRKSRDTLLLITFLCFVGGTLWRVWPAGGRSAGQVAHLTALRAHQQVSRAGDSSDSSEGSPTGQYRSGGSYDSSEGSPTGQNWWWLI